MPAALRRSARPCLIIGRSVSCGSGRGAPNARRDGPPPSTLALPPPCERRVRARPRPPAINIGFARTSGTADPCPRRLPGLDFLAQVPVLVLGDLAGLEAPLQAGQALGLLL